MKTDPKKLALPTFIAFLLSLAYFFSTTPSVTALVEKKECTNIHWHALLEIEIKGNQVTIPPNTGIEIGKVRDTEISGGPHSPVHTHAADNTLHIESTCLEKKPEVLKLSYFFEMWGEKFDKNCIFEHCNNGVYEVAMYVNGIRSNEFENYEVKDGDEIEITYRREKIEPTTLQFSGSIG